MAALALLAINDGMKTRLCRLLSFVLGFAISIFVRTARTDEFSITLIPLTPHSRAVQTVPSFRVPAAVNDSAMASQEEIRRALENFRRSVLRATKISESHYEEPISVFADDE